MTLLTVFVADDHSMFRQAFVRILRENKTVGEIKEAKNGKELLAMIESTVPDIIILDIEMPEMDGIEVLKKISSRYPEIKIIIISMHEERLTIGKALRHGAVAYLPKSADVSQFEVALETVSSGRAYSNPLMKEALQYVESLDDNTNHRSHQIFSAKQKAIIDLICRQLTNRQIALELSLSEHTVRNHKVRMMKKLKVKNAQGLVKFAVENGLNFTGKE